MTAQKFPAPPQFRSLHYQVPPPPPMGPESSYRYTEQRQMDVGPFYVYYPGPALGVRNLKVPDPFGEPFTILTTLPSTRVVPIISRPQWVESRMASGTVVYKRVSKDPTGAMFFEDAVLVYAETIKQSLFSTHGVRGIVEITDWAHMPIEFLDLGVFMELIHPFPITMQEPLTAEQDEYLAPFIKQAQRELRLGPHAGLTQKLAQVLAGQAKFANMKGELKEVYEAGVKAIIMGYKQTTRAAQSYVDRVEAEMRQSEGQGVGRTTYDDLDNELLWLLGRAKALEALQNVAGAAGSPQSIQVTLPQGGLTKEDLIEALKIVMAGNQDTKGERKNAKETEAKAKA